MTYTNNYNPLQAKFIEEKCKSVIVVENKKRLVIIQDLIKRGYPSDPMLEWKRKFQPNELEKEEVTEEDGETKESVKKEEDAATVSVKGYDYLLGMSMWFLTDEKRKELLKDRDAKLAELNAMKNTTIQTMWMNDLEALEKKLDEVEAIERMIEAGQEVKKKRGGPKGKETPAKERGKKKNAAQESAPSKMSEKIMFEVTSEVLSKYEKAAAGPKVPKIKKEKAAPGENGDVDEIDALIAKKPKAEKKPAGEKVKKEPKPKKEPGLKQSKLGFSSEKKKRAKKKTSDDEDDDLMDNNNSDVEFDVKDIMPARDRPSARAAAKKVVYQFSEDEEEKKDDSEPELFDNDLSEKHNHDRSVIHMSDDDSDKEDAAVSKKAVQNVSSDDMFDSLKVVSKPATKPAVKRKPKDLGSDEDLPKRVSLQVESNFVGGG